MSGPAGPCHGHLAHGLGERLRKAVGRAHAAPAAIGERRRFSMQRGCGRNHKSGAWSREMTRMAAKSAHAACAVRAAPHRTSAALVLPSMARAPRAPPILIAQPHDRPGRPRARVGANRLDPRGWNQAVQIPGDRCRIWATAVHRHSSEATDRRATCRQAPCNLASRATADPWRGRLRASCRASG